ncbi:MAG: hypothetical protein ACTTI2_05345 [Bacteroidales bacterium]
MLVQYTRKNKSFPKGKVLEEIPSLDTIINKFLETGELIVNSQDTVGYDYDSNTPENMDSVPQDKGLIDLALEGKAVPNTLTVEQVPDNQTVTETSNEGKTE